MRRMALALAVACSLAAMACSSVEVTKVNSSDLATESDAVAVVQASELGLNLLWGFVPIAEASLDSVVNKTLIAEAKAMGGNRVEIVTMYRINPDQFPFNFQGGGLVNVNGAVATGIAVK